jgi:hypothetical protein
MKVNNYPVKTPAAGDKLFGSDASGDQKQFDMSAVSSNVFQYQIGEYVADEGGVIFHRYLDGTTQNYLVIDTTNLSTSQVWSNVASTLIGASAQSSWNGLSNSDAIVGQSGFTTGAAKLCLDSTNNSQTDWYLPSLSELNLLSDNLFNINKTLSGNSSYGSISGATEISSNTYWSSTEFNSTIAWTFGFFTALGSNGFTKNNSYYVRAVRKFSI